MENLTIYGVAAVPVIMGIVEGAKAAGLPKKWAPTLSVCLGVAAGVFIIAPGNVTEGIVVGLALGLTPVGLYSGTKNTVQNDH